MIEKIIDEKFMDIRKSPNGKNIVGLKYDRHYNIPNYLIEAYRLKSFSYQDINPRKSIL